MRRVPLQLPSYFIRKFSNKSTVHFSCHTSNSFKIFLAGMELTKILYNFIHFSLLSTGPDYYQLQIWFSAEMCFFLIRRKKNQVLTNICQNLPFVYVFCH